MVHMSNNKDLTETMAYNAEDLRQERIKEILKDVKSALEDRGFQAINQISGYLISNDPAYISSNRNARNIIQEVERYEIIEELVRYYLSENK